MSVRSFSFRGFLAGGALALGLMIVGAGCQSSASPHTTSRPQGFYVGKAYSLPLDLFNTGVTYDDQIKMSAPAAWQTTQFETLSVAVPYSSDWTVEKRSVLPLNEVAGPQSPNIDVSFGRFVSAGTYFLREYQLKVSYQFRTLDETAFETVYREPERIDEQGKPFFKPRETLTIGKVKGISYLRCVAKGCSTNFFGFLPHYTIELIKLYPMGQDDLTHSITPEMEQIIASIQPAEEVPLEPLVRASSGPIEELNADDVLSIKEFLDTSLQPVASRLQPNWRLPAEVAAPQINSGYRLTESVTAVFVQQTNMNHPLYDARGDIWQGTSTFVGVIVTSDNGQTWKKLFEVPPNIGACEGRERFNPVGMFIEQKRFYLDIADDCGAGSGEGNLIRYVSPDGVSWKREKCYYLMPEKYVDHTLHPVPTAADFKQLTQQACSI